VNAAIGLGDDASIEELRAAVMTHLERLAPVLGLQALMAPIGGILARKGNLAKDGEFWSIVGQNVTAVRHRRNAPLPLRRAKVIAPAEYQMAILTIIGQAVGISGDDLVVETARIFGFDRTGRDLKEAIDRQVERLVKEGQLDFDQSGLRLPGNASDFQSHSFN
jgi:hypothetical protein